MPRHTMRFGLLGLVCVILLVCCWGGGWAMAQTLGQNTLIAPQAIAAQTTPKTPIPTNPHSVDPIPTRYYPGYEAYMETCRGCHLALPPEVLPLEAWQEILRRPDEHYGVSVPNINRFTQLLIWDYVSTFSRPLPPNTPVPIYTEKSRYFKALHPKVTLPAEVSTQTCITCHPKANLFDFVTLTPEWQNAP